MLLVRKRKMTQYNTTHHNDRKDTNKELVDRIRASLNGIASTFRSPQFIFPRLEKGDLVHGSILNGHWYAYQIDDPDIYRALGDCYPTEAIPFKQIDEIFRSETESMYEEGLANLLRECQTREGTTIIPYSKAVERRNGCCLERSILFQLAAQARGEFDSYLIVGRLKIDDAPYRYHAYNIIFTKGSRAFLVDTAWKKARLIEDIEFSPHGPRLKTLQLEPDAVSTDYLLNGM